MENSTHKIERVMHPLKFRLLRVKAVIQLSEHMKRITLTGEDLADFNSASPDDHVKVFFPKPGELKPRVPEVGPSGPVIPEGEDRPIMRDYTPVRFDNAAKELDLEFFLHESSAATTWAKGAQVGHYLGIGGPRGSMIVPYDFDWYLMIGDEAAIPSFTRRLRELPAGVTALVFIEVGGPADVRTFESQALVQTQWIYRGARSAGSPELLKKEVLKTAFPHGDYFSWIATELQCSKDLKEMLETVRGANPDWIKATGYWKKD